jgi:chromosome segregation ATPase
MATEEKSGSEILLEQLTKQVASLSSEQKAKEAIIKELNEQIKIAERESAEQIKKAKAEAERQISELQASIVPLKELQATCESLRQDIAVLKHEKIDAVTDIKTAKGEAIKEADSLLAKSAARLSKIELTISECKAKVASL